MMKRMWQMVLMVVFLVLGVVACTPGSELAVPAGAGADMATEASAADDGAAALNPVATPEAADAEAPVVDEAALDEAALDEAALDTATQDSPLQDVVVESTPLSEEELANQEPGGAPGGTGESDAGGGSDPNVGTGLVAGDEEINPAEWPAYADPTYRFSVRHPADFVIRPLDSAKLAEFTPTPLTSIRFMSPAIANSDVGDLDIPELNARIFPAPPDGSLESWLAASGLTAEGDSVEPYQNAAVSGIRACLSTMLAPNCSIFVLGNGWVYQLTPLGLVGETMVDSFSLSS